MSEERYLVITYWHYGGHNSDDARVFTHEPTEAEALEGLSKWDGDGVDVYKLTDSSLKHVIRYEIEE